MNYLLEVQGARKLPTLAAGTSSPAGAGIMFWVTRCDVLRRWPLRVIGCAGAEGDALRLRVKSEVRMLRASEKLMWLCERI